MLVSSNNISYNKNCLRNKSIKLLGIPFDGTVSYRPGSRFAPSTLRNEWYGIETYSPYQDKDLEDYCVEDLGDVEVPIGNTLRTLECIEAKVSEVISKDSILISIGGEHLVTYPIIKAFSKVYENLCIIHLDAHADLREDYLGEKLSHATVIRLCHDILGDDRIFQFGIRSGTKDEFCFASSGKVKMHKFTLKGLEEISTKIGNRPTYLTIDLDVLDPSVFPGTGTPEPGGASFNDLVDFIIRMKNLNIVGADIVELSPHYDHSGVSTAVACKVLRELMLAVCK